ncbi:oligopeptide transporter 1 [[Candida] jaroonii]|uniref:Oligopeptide transporter 1 n=1 Tax=[Candida] jaroonii TaxID=467808 RepID=A0ACA9Y4K4_9ASCO|nr:oligopeptide transporter 1 [[Candida] jaroonii]
MESKTAAEIKASELEKDVYVREEVNDSITSNDIPTYGANDILDESADDAPLPEVRSVVKPTDEDLPVNTFRAWFLGIIFTIVGSGINLFFSLRYPGITISSIVAQLVSYPLGQGLAQILPLWEFDLGKLGKFVLNPDRKFNKKEHTIITIMANISFTASWATDVIQAQYIYGVPAPAGYQILMVLTCQLFGLGVAGLMDEILVKDSYNYWPNTMANVALFDSLHSRTNSIADGWSISRYKFFLIVFAGSFTYYFLPGFLFQALSYFTWICWIVPKNVVVNQIFGQVQGLGFSPITFDWSQISYANGSPLLIPFWPQIMTIFGWVIFFGILPLILYYKNSMFFAYLPISSSTVFDNTGNTYNGSRVLDLSTMSLDEQAYKAYSPPFLASTYAISYGLSYAVLSSSVVYVVLYHGKDIYGTFTRGVKEDVHVRLMNKYPSVPRWWYAVLIVLIYALTIVTMEVYDSKFPVYGITIALFMVFLFILPIGIVYARTNINTNCMTVLGQIIAGYAINPAKPIVSLAWKFYAYTGVSQAMAFSQDMKLGYYMKVPKRTVFWAQLSSCIVGALVQVGILIAMLNNVEDICSADQVSHFTCPQGTTNFAASVVWALVGPKRLVSPGKIYSGFLHLFWIGPVLVLITWALQKKFPSVTVLKNWNWVVVFGAMGNYPPATGINYTAGTAVGLLFNYYIKKRWGNWWLKYNFVLSCALDIGVALSGIFIFFCLSLPGVSLSWWGNDVYGNTADGQLSPYLNIPGKGFFGPDSWS